MTEPTTTAITPKLQPLRFVDGDLLRSAAGDTWRRGLTAPGLWERFPLAPEAGALRDDQARAMLASRDGWLFVPTLPTATVALPGTACTTADQVRSLELRPATGAAMYALSLGRVQSFLGNEHGSAREGMRPALLRLADMRATLEGVRARRPAAGVTYHRTGGRAYVRYAVGSTLHTHVYLLTT
ncbi:hypothetical protein [Streptomyces sp. NBC_01601]|uniref:hypothetical protein n=1 Tax=Streptomyces sp. NBC_01601 TaxID=2975892 RepID=UPI002E2AABF1|nr:hypothetical protein [Streptomyces sp. NBC_01601]